MTSSLFTTLLSLFKSTGTVVTSYIDLSTSILSGFGLAKSDFAANLDVSTPVAFFKFVFVA